MKSEHRIRRHPARRELVAYAEALVDRRAPVSAATASHLSRCNACSNEMSSIRASLEFATSAKPLEPSNDLTAQIFIGANRERTIEKYSAKKVSTLRLACRGLAYACALLLITTLYFGAALQQPYNTSESTATGILAQTHANSIASIEAIHEIINEIHTLSAAVQFAPGDQQTPLEREQRRAVHAMDEDIVAALDALERNPGSLQANHTILASLQRQADTLRALYVEQSL